MAMSCLDDWTHAARQFPDGRWTSKLGQGADIIQWSPRALVGDTYGDALLIMKRRTTTITADAGHD
jgi:hypothetical protein